MDKNNSGAGFIVLAVLTAFVPVLAWAAGVRPMDRISGESQPVFWVAALILYIALPAGMIYLYRLARKKAACEAAQRSQDLRRREREMDLIRDMADHVHKAADAEALYRSVLDQAMQAVGVKNGSVFAVDSTEPEGLRFVAARPELVLKNNDGRSCRHSFVRTVIETGKSLVVTDIEHDPRTMKTNDPKYGSPSFISLPICNNRKVLAVLNLANKQDGSVFTREDERVLSIMLGEAGMALENQALRKTISDQLAQIRDLTARLRP